MSTLQDNESQPLVLLQEIADPTDLLCAAALEAVSGGRNIDRLTVDDLARELDRQRSHLVLALSGWAALRRVLPLMAGLGARRLTVLLESVDESCSLGVPWQVLTAGDIRGAVADSEIPGGLAVHATLMGWLRKGQAGGVESPAQGLRVGLHDRVGESWVAGDPHAFAVTRTGLQTLLDSDVAALGDVVVTSRHHARAIALLAGAPPVVSVQSRWSAGAVRGPSWVELATVEQSHLRWSLPNRRSSERIIEASPLPPADIGVVNPVGFLPEGVDGYGRTYAERGWEVVGLRDPGNQPIVQMAQGAPLDTSHIASLRRLRGVRDRNESHRGPLEQARLLSQLAAAGIPLLVEPLPESVRLLLGRDLSEVLMAAEQEELDDDFCREAYSVALRRVALRDHSPRARWAEMAASLPYRPRPHRTISVLLATRRPALIEHALHQVRQQRDVDAEVVLALHGDGFDVEAVRANVADAGLPAQIVHAPESEVFGDVLNRATEHCSGDLVAKMDDDDWYGPYHLWDAAAALGYSGATLVGRPAQFVHLDVLDVTVRRTREGSERFASQVAGGTLLLRRDDLKEVGGWRPVPRAVDRFLCRQLSAEGGTIYRQHGFGYLLCRRAAGHTWDSQLNRFLRSSVMQWRGARLDMATADLRDAISPAAMVR